MERKIGSGEELQQFAAEFIRDLAPSKTATIVALSGDLGAGKTTFAQGVARALGVEDVVTSPTFVIEKVYELPVLSGVEGENQKWQHLIHIDAYRLKSAHELRVLGWEEIAREPENLILIEWPERAPELIPQDAIRLRFDIEGDGRKLTLSSSSARQ